MTRPESDDGTRSLELEQLKIASPCHESWAGMSGDDTRRFCERCELQVYNLSGMTRDQATEIVSEAEGRLCVRFHRRADGTVLTRDCPVGLAARTGRFLKACAAGLLALMGFLPGCTITGSPDHGGEGSSPVGAEGPGRGEAAGHEEQVLQGDVCIEELGEVDSVEETEDAATTEFAPAPEVLQGRIRPEEPEKD